MLTQAKKPRLSNINIVMVSILVVAALVLLAVVLIVSSGNQPTSNQQTTLQSSNRNEEINSEPKTVTMNVNGFEPRTLIIMQGDNVIFKNIDSEDHWPASNDHPTHQNYSEFDPRRPINPGESWSFTFQNPGTWDFHDHLFPPFEGTIVVKL